MVKHTLSFFYLIYIQTSIFYNFKLKIQIMEVPKSTNLKMYDIRNHYKVIDKVGKGTYGTVFKVLNLQDNKHYAIKKFQNTQAKLQAEGFPITALRQISLLKQIHHINIINLQQIICSKPNKRNLYRGSTFLVFDYMDHDFAGLFRNRIKFTLPEIKCFLKQILEGCNYLHQNKIMHRDIKSANILLNDQGIVQLADFGLGRRTRFDSMYTYKVVTLWYRAPQLLLGCKSYNHKVDVWSIGCVFAQFLLGQVLFRKDSQYAIIERIYQICGGLQENQFTQEYLKSCTYYQDMKPKRSYSKNFIQQIKKIKPQIDQGSLIFLRDLLQLNPYKRISCQQALNHQFFKQSPQACQPRQIQKLDYQYHEMFKDRSMKIQRTKLSKQKKQPKYKGWSEEQEQKNKMKDQNQLKLKQQKSYPTVAPYIQNYRKPQYNQTNNNYYKYNGHSKEYSYKKFQPLPNSRNYSNYKQLQRKAQSSSESSSSTSSSSSSSSQKSGRQRSRENKHKQFNKYKKQDRFDTDYRQKRKINYQEPKYERRQYRQEISYHNKYKKDYRNGELNNIQNQLRPKRQFSDQIKYQDKKYGQNRHFQKKQTYQSRRYNYQSESKNRLEEIKSKKKEDESNQRRSYKQESYNQKKLHFQDGNGNKIQKTYRKSQSQVDPKRYYKHQNEKHQNYYVYDKRKYDQEKASHYQDRHVNYRSRQYNKEYQKEYSKNNQSQSRHKQHHYKDKRRQSYSNQRKSRKQRRSQDSEDSEAMRKRQNQKDSVKIYYKNNNQHQKSNYKSDSYNKYSRQKRDTYESDFKRQNYQRNQHQQYESNHYEKRQYDRPRWNQSHDLYPRQKSKQYSDYDKRKGNEQTYFKGDSVKNNQQFKSKRDKHQEKIQY